MRFEPRELIDPGGDVVGAAVDQIGRVGGGLEVQQRIWCLYRLRDGLVIRQKVYFDEEPALEELRRA